MTRKRKHAQSSLVGIEPLAADEATQTLGVDDKDDIPKRRRLTAGTHKKAPNDDLAKATRALRRFHFDDPRDKLPLGEFPREIVRQIGDHLPVDSLLSLAATCKNLKRLLRPVTKHLEVDRTSRQTFARFLERDAISRTAARERASVHDYMRACSACMKLHHVVDFSATQLLQSPKTRKCRGQEAVLRLCEHMTVSWEFLRKSEMDWSQICHDFGCMLRCKKERPGIMTSPSQTHDIAVVARFTLSTFKRGATVYEKDIRASLGRLGFRICPHTVTNSNQFADLEGLEVNHKPEEYRILGAFEKCPDSSCSTRFRVDAHPRLFSTSIELVIERIVGALVYADDTDWLVQCGAN
ncbi:uncharacterized protein J3D65DRAFT_678941 [Phyllosticta citribraziliensis]|uniref:F-box domain-containing protein n=1 Tax=Phyllosticta citribraziliensis TaxID=989973 RepID=A0ABR1LFG1_9PEZI